MAGSAKRSLAGVLASGTAGLALLAAAGAFAAAPPQATLTPDSQGAAKAEWTGSVSPGSETLGDDQGALCFGASGKPDPSSGCDFFALDVNTPSDFYDKFVGDLALHAGGFGLSDIDLFVYRRKADGTVGDYVTGSGSVIGIPESAAVPKAQGAYWVVLTPYTVLPGQSYQGSAELVVKPRVSPTTVNDKAPPGFVNYRASHDAYTSHSEPTIVMDPLDHSHLIAGSKMYENNAKYLFKIGTYESHDGGRTWTDQGQLPGYCQAAGQCDPTKEATYRTTSDVAMAFDDEGNAYANVLDAPGGTFAFQGFNETVHIKRPGKPWSGPITIHDNRNNPITAQLLLDDKNWIAVDNATDVNGGPNRPRDGKIGTMYVCWSLDGTNAPLQQIVLMRSLDGGKTWGGLVPGDNLPYQLSQRLVISGVGCHIAIGPRGEVYVTWYDNLLGAIEQVKSTNRGRSFSLAAPIALITGVDQPFDGQAFRNLSIPTTAVDQHGNVYVVVTSRDAAGESVPLRVIDKVRQLAGDGEVTKDTLRELLRPERLQEGAPADKPGSGADVVLFKSTNGGRSYTGPVRVNQDPPQSDADQFQPWLAVTDKGQLDISYFDKRNDPKNFYIDTYLSRSNDGGRTFTDTRVTRQLWDPSINPPTSVSGEFIGDYQGLVADDDVAIPFWNDTQLYNLPAGDKDRSPWQEVFAARIPNTPASFIVGASSAVTFRPHTRSVVASAAKRAHAVTILGSASDPSGGRLTRVDVSVRTKRGRRCFFYSPARRRFAARPCSRPLFFIARGAGQWRVALRRAAFTPGTYTVVSRASDAQGRVESGVETGRNTQRIVVKRAPKRR